MKKTVLLLLFWGMMVSGGNAGDDRCYDLEALCNLSGRPGVKTAGRSGYGLNLRNASQPLFFRNCYSYVPAPSGWSLRFSFRLSDGFADSAVLSSGAWENFLLRIRNSREISLTYHGRNGRKNRCSVFYEFIPGNWYDCFVTQQKDGRISFYVNGVLQKAFPEQPLPDRYAAIELVGAYGVNGKGRYDKFFQGMLDNLKLYKSCLDSRKIHSEWLAFNDSLPLTPMPQQISRDPEKLVLPKEFRLDFRTALLPREHAGWQALQKYLSSQGLPFVAADLSEPEKAPSFLREYLDPSCFPAEGYVLALKKEGIWLYAASAAGLQYGLQTFCQLQKQKSDFSGVIFDYPENRLRCAMYVNDARPPLRLTEDLQRNIREFAARRIHYLMLRTHDWFLTDDPQVRKALQAVGAYCALHGMTVLPYMQNYGHAKGALYFNPRFGHTATIHKEEHRVPDSGTVVLKRGCVFHSPEIPVQVLDGSGTVLREGVDYRVEIQDWVRSWMPPKGKKIPYSWARPYVDAESGKGTLIFSRKCRGRIVRVTYDIHDHGECTCPFSRAFQEYAERMMENALKLTGSDYINFGLDEIWSIRGRGRCCSTEITGRQETLGFAFNSLFEAAQRVRPGIRVMVFGDMLDPNETPSWKTPEVDSGFARFFNRDIQMMPWFYDDTWKHDHLIRASVGYFVRHGFRVTGVSGLLPLNQVLWQTHLQPLIASGQSDGFFYTMWDDMHQEDGQWAGLPMYSQLTWSPSHFRIPEMNRLRMLLDDAGIAGEKSQSELRSFLKDCAPGSQFLVSIQQIYPKAAREYRELREKIPAGKLDLPGWDRVEEAFRLTGKILRQWNEENCR